MVQGREGGPSMLAVHGVRHWNPEATNATMEFTCKPSISSLIAIQTRSTTAKQMIQWMDDTASEQMK